MRRFNRTFKLTKDEVRTIARNKGWRGGKTDDRSMDGILNWLNGRGIEMGEVISLAKQMRAAATGTQVTSTSAPTVAGMSRSEVEAMVKSNSSVAAVDESVIRRLVTEAISAATPGKIVLDGPTSKPIVMKHRTHPLFEKTLRLVRAGLNVLLVGPAGCGKTTLAHHISTALKRTYGTLHCTAGASESQLTGWLLPIGAGKNPNAFSYVPSEFVRLYEEGNSVFLLDEIDAADPNMMLVINGALANGSLHVQQRYQDPHVSRGKNVAIMAAANTYGTGADTMYAGRNQLDAATLDRFYTVEMGYDPSLEAELIGCTPEAITPWTPAEKPDAMELAAIGTWVNQLRRQVKEHRLRRVVSTRTIQKAVAARLAGIPLHEVKKDLLAGWTRDELVKVGGVQ